MLKELQTMIDGWKQEAARLEAYNQTEHDECFYFQNKGEIKRLRQAASEAELLLLHNY